MALLAGFVTGGLGSGIPLLMKEFHVDLNSAVNAAVNWPVLMLGVGVHLLLLPKFYAINKYRYFFGFLLFCILVLVQRHLRPHFCVSHV
jgi:hypothetical protein